MQRALCVDPAALPLAQRRKFLKLTLEVFRRTGEDKPEGYAAVLSIDRMMKPVRLIEAPQIPLLGVKADIDAVMNERVVGEEVHRAIGRDAEGGNQRPGGAIKLNAPGEQSDGDRGEEQAEGVVQLPDALARLVMAFVQNPKEAVHNILMQKPGHAFHCEKYGKK